MRNFRTLFLSSILFLNCNSMPAHAISWSTDYALKKFNAWSKHQSSQRGSETSRCKKDIAPEVKSCQWVWNRRVIEVEDWSLLRDAPELSSLSKLTTSGDLKRWNRALFEEVDSIKESNKKNSGDEKTLTLKISKGKSHAVKNGETLESIALSYSVPVESLEKLNRKILKPLERINSLRPHPSANLLQPGKLPLQVMELKLVDCPKPETGFYKVVKNGKIEIHAEILVIVDPTGENSQITESEDAIFIQSHLQSTFSYPNKVKWQEKEWAVEFHFKAQPFVVNDFWKKEDFRWLFRNTGRETGEKDQYTRMRVAYAFPVRYTSKEEMTATEQAYTNYEIVVSDRRTDERVLDHEMAHAFMSFYHQLQLGHTYSNNSFDHSTGGILSNPTQPVSAKNIEYFIQGLPSAN